MDQKTLGKSLQQAREQAGLTQEAVEHAIGLPQKAMTRIEAGLRAVSTLELSKLASLLHVNVADFFNITPAADDNPLVVLHRVDRGLENDPKIQEQVAKYFQIFREGTALENLLGIRNRHSQLHSSFPIPKNTVDAIQQGEEAATEERRRLGLGNFPIYDIITVLSSQGIWTTSTPLPNEMSGLFLHHASFGMAILVNAMQARSRQLFSYAHEYAHAIFDQRRQYVVSDSTNISDPIETRANAFAAAFLLPREGVIEIIHQLGKGLPNRHIFTVYDEANDEIIEAENRHQASSQKLTPQNIALIAHHFGVSYQATVYRLQSLRQISPKEKDELLHEESIGKEYLKILHLCEDSREQPFQTELTARLSHLILEAYQQEKISRGRVLELCKLLSLPSKQLMEMAEKRNPL